MTERQYALSSADETREYGARLGRALFNMPVSQPIVIFLSGELGAGKTTLVAGLLRAVGVLGPIRSPTYTLIEPYELATLDVYHLDLYRLGDARELEMLALRDLLQPGAVLLVEWAERAEGALPAPDLVLSLCYPDADDSGLAAVEERRIVHATARTPIGESLVDKLLGHIC